MRTYFKAMRGQLFASTWVEWHVECAVKGCEERALAVAMGQAKTLKEAEKCADRTDELDGWKKIKGLWHCQNHAARKTAGKTTP